MKKPLIILSLWAMMSAFLFAEQNVCPEGSIVIDGQHFSFDGAPGRLIPMLKSSDIEEQKKGLGVVNRIGKGWIAFDNVVAAVEELVGSPNDEISSSAAQILLRIGSNHSRETFKKMCSSDDFSLRFLGARGLQRIGQLNEPDLNLVVDVYLNMFDEPLPITEEMSANMKGSVVMGLEELAKESGLPMINMQDYMRGKMSDNKQENKKHFEEYFALTLDWWRQHRDEVVLKLTTVANQ